MNVFFKNSLNLRYFLLFSLFFYPQISQADFLSGLNHWVKNEYSKARAEAAKLEQQILHDEKEMADAARYVAAKEAEVFNEIATDMVADIKAAIEFFKSLEPNNFEGECKAEADELISLTGPLATAYEHIENDLVNHLPKIELAEKYGVYDNSAKLDFLLNPASLDYQQCQLYEAKGMACGVFPYVQHIITAVLEGRSNSEHLYRAIGDAYQSDECSIYSNPLDPTSRGMCALMIPIIKEAQKGYSCVSQIVEDTIDGRNGAPIESGSEKQSSGSGALGHEQAQICELIGEVAFGMGMDSLIGRAIPTNAEKAQKIYKIARRLRLVLNIQAKIEDSNIDELCNEGIHTDMHSGKIPTQKISTLSDNDPGHGLKLISQLDSPICLDFIRDPQKVGGWHCHGGLNQRWDFHLIEGTDRDYVIESRYNRHCLKMSDTDLSYGLGTCYKNEVHESKTFRITPDGELESLKTGACLKNMGHNTHAVGGRCISPTTSKGQQFGLSNTDESGLSEAERETAVRQGRMYVSDPSLSALKGAPGANRQIYANAETPICFNTTDDSARDMNVFPCNHDNFQSWSFHSYKDNEQYSEYFQIVNDHTGHCITTRGHGQTAKTEHCDQIHTEPHRQMYLINDGRLQNLHSGLCLQARGFSKKDTIVEEACSDHINQKWYLFAK